MTAAQKEGPQAQPQQPSSVNWVRFTRPETTQILDFDKATVSRYRYTVRVMAPRLPNIQDTNKRLRALADTSRRSTAASARSGTERFTKLRGTNKPPALALCPCSVCELKPPNASPCPKLTHRCADAGVLVNNLLKEYHKQVATNTPSLSPPGTEALWSRREATAEHTSDSFTRDSPLIRLSVGLADQAAGG